MGNVLSRQRLHRYRVAVMTPLVSSSHYCSYSSFKTISDQQKHQEFSTKVYADKPKIISRLRWARGKVKAYLELAKYKLSALVVVTSGAGFISAGALDSSIISACIGKSIFSLNEISFVYCFNSIGTALCAAAAGTFNQYIERDRDILMNRTRYSTMQTPYSFSVIFFSILSYTLNQNASVALEASESHRSSLFRRSGGHLGRVSPVHHPSSLCCSRPFEYYSLRGAVHLFEAAC